MPSCLLTFMEQHHPRSLPVPLSTLAMVIYTYMWVLTLLLRLKLQILTYECFGLQVIRTCVTTPPKHLQHLVPREVVDTYSHWEKYSIQVRKGSTLTGLFTISLQFTWSNVPKWTSNFVFRVWCIWQFWKIFFLFGLRRNAFLSGDWPKL